MFCQCCKTSSFRKGITKGIAMKDLVHAVYKSLAFVLG